jgi:hypothetical protein
MHFKLRAMAHKRTTKNKNVDIKLNALDAFLK